MKLLTVLVGVVFVIMCSTFLVYFHVLDNGIHVQQGSEYGQSIEDHPWIQSMRNSKKSPHGQRNDLKTPLVTVLLEGVLNQKERRYEGSVAESIARTFIKGDGDSFLPPEYYNNIGVQRHTMDPVSAMSLYQSNHYHDQNVPVSNHDAAPQAPRPKQVRVEPARLHRHPPAPVPGYTEEDCPAVEFNELKYWKSIPSDLEFTSPWASLTTPRTDISPSDPDYDSKNVKYVSFEPDRGGWNNVRMAMETVLVFAHLTGRTLVMPPPVHLYLLNKGHKKHDFGAFFPMDEFAKRVPIISMEEFLQKECIGGNLSRGKLPPTNTEERTYIDKALWPYIRDIADHKPKWDPFKHCIVWELGLDGEGVGGQGSGGSGGLSPPDFDMQTFCTKQREPVRYEGEIAEANLVHFMSDQKNGYRIFTHFYNLYWFNDGRVDRYYKRLVRDTVHYRDNIFCHAARVFKLLKHFVQDFEAEHGRVVAAEANDQGLTQHVLGDIPAGERDGRNGPLFLAFHIRRGDLQYKEVKIPMEKMYANVQDQLPANIPIYVATDEKNRTFFDHLTSRHEVRFLDDFFTEAGLGDINGNLIGMIETIVCSKAAVLYGTWFSTFTGYITRLRGYRGYPTHSNWYTLKRTKRRMQEEETQVPYFPWYVREWPTAWVDIDREVKAELKQMAMAEGRGGSGGNGGGNGLYLPHGRQRRRRQRRRRHRP